MSLDGKTTFIELVYLGTFRTFRNVHYYKQSMILWLPGGGGEREGWIGSLGLADANYYVQNG